MKESDLSLGELVFLMRVLMDLLMVTEFDLNLDQVIYYAMVESVFLKVRLIVEV